MSKIMKGTVSDLESKVIDALDKLCRIEERSWKNKGWTSRLKEALIQLAHDTGHIAYASQVEKRTADGVEWLYDLVWLDYSPGEQVLTRAILVLESEWSSKREEIERDFRKLLLARADLRLMVFQVRNDNEWQGIIDRLKTLVSLYEQSEDGDRYLLSGWRSDSREFQHCILCARTIGDVYVLYKTSQNL